MGTPAPEPQRVLAGRYRLEQRLGAGGMGAIWRAQHLVLQAPVAVKLIDRDAVPDDDTVGRFLREAKAAAALRSPHVVQILDYGMDGGVPFIVMELLEGETLSQRLKRLGRLSPGDTVRFVTHVGRAIGRAHEAGIVHRDLKPENVFIVHNEDEEIAKVLDFGVAKIEPGALGTEGTRTRTGSILGTPYYMSPEQAQGNKAVDHRSDLWSLAVIAFECLTGKRPFYSEGLGDLVLQICVRDIPVPSEFGIVPAGFDAWFARAVSRDPDLRFQSPREMTDALREALGLESREPPSTMPDVVGASSPTAARDAEPEAPGARRRSDRPDPDAPTVELAPEEVQRLAKSGISTTRESSHLHEGHGGLGSVVAVAAAALALGLGGGIYALDRWREDKPLPSAEPAPEVLARTPGGAPAPGRVEAVPAPSPDISSAEAALEPAPSASAARLAPSGSSPRARPEDVVPDAGASTLQSPDAGWVKPAWAIPDEEPNRAEDVVEP